MGEDIFAKAASSVKASDAAPSTPVSIPGVPKGIDLDGKIIVHKTERETDGGPKSALDKVAAAVAGINQKLSKAGVMRQGVPIDNKGPDAGAYHATLEINDFPRKFTTPPPILSDQALTILKQSEHDGRSPIGRMLRRSSSRQAHLLRQKVRSILLEKNQVSARSQSCTSWWRATPSLWLHRQ